MTMRVVAYFIITTFSLSTLHAAEQSTQSGDAVAMPQSEETHQVQQGDTLWDLTARYLQNPWYWPKVWSYNPQLSNPHFIYPGQTVRFFPSNEQLPARIEASAMRDMPGEQGAAAASQDAPEDDPADATPDRDDSGRQPKASDISVAGNRPLTYNSTRGMVVQTVQLVTEKELKEAGEIANAFDDKKLLSTYDIIYIKWGKESGVRPQTGSPLIMYKMVEEVEHPHTGNDYFMTQITGSAEVLESGDQDDPITARIVKTFEPVERGQFVAPQKGPLLVELSETPNTKKLDGFVMTGGVYSKQLLGQFHYVFVDRGTKDGVANGNSFVITSNKDHFVDGEKVPKRTIGKLLVVDAKESASLALVTQSLRDIAPGDPIEMREK